MGASAGQSPIASKEIGSYRKMVFKRLRESWTGRKSNEEVLQLAGVKFSLIKKERDS